MVSKLIAPDKVLEKIRDSGKRASDKDMECCGYLFGSSSENSPITVLVQCVSIRKKPHQLAGGMNFGN